MKYFIKQNLKVFKCKMLDVLSLKKILASGVNVVPET